MIWLQWWRVRTEQWMDKTAWLIANKIAKWQRQWK